MKNALGDHFKPILTREKDTQAAEVEEAFSKYTLYFTENTSEVDSGQLDCFIDFFIDWFID